MAKRKHPTAKSLRQGQTVYVIDADFKNESGFCIRSGMVGRARVIEYDSWAGLKYVHIGLDSGPAYPLYHSCVCPQVRHGRFIHGTIFYKKAKALKAMKAIKDFGTNEKKNYCPISKSLGLHS